MRKSLVLFTIAVLCACGPQQTSENAVPVATFDIAADETVVFFSTSGWLDAATDEWHLPVHGWIYEPEDSLVRKSVFEKVLSKRYGLVADDETSQRNLGDRLNLLIADNERGKSVVINLAGRSVELPPSAPNGHFQGVVTVPAAEIGEQEFVHYTAVSNEAEPRVFDGAVQLVPQTGTSVISDIDDTVKISNVTDRKRLLEYTFLLDFEAVPGMADLYRDWSTRNVTIHFVSSSPWQLYPALQEFLEANGFPWATFSLKAVRFRDDTLLDLFAKGTETKPAAIKAILDRYPGRTFVLVGDSGEQDPEVYAELLRQRNDQVAAVYIRNVTQETADNSRFTAVFAGIDESRWQLFDDADELARGEL